MALVWFRSDLRVADNPALYEACRSSEQVSALFVECPGQWREAHDWGEPKIDFVRRSVGALKADLASTGIALRVRRCERFSEVAGAVVEEARSVGSRRVLCNREYEANERSRDQEVAAACGAADVAFEDFEDQAIVPVGSLRTRQGKPYSVFTPFWRAWLGQVGGTGYSPLPRPEARPPVRASAATDAEPRPKRGAFRPDLWPAGEAAAGERLLAFLSGPAASYPELRDLPSTAGTSLLSPYLAVGSLSPRQALAAAIAANQGEIERRGSGASAWIRQLAWRDFYRHVLLGFPWVSRSRPFRRRYEGVAWRQAPSEFDAWCEGLTGVPIVDAGMRQLRLTGWMHNRLRMVTAMFLTKHLLMDWRLGERFFSRHLVDTDLANNNGGWQWSASVGTDAAPYFRIFNPWRQGERFDAEGGYIRKFVPELAAVSRRALHGEGGAGLEERRATGYPAPIVEHSEARARALAFFRFLDT